MAKWGEIKCPRCEMLEEHLCLTEEKLAKAVAELRKLGEAGKANGYGSSYIICHNCSDTHHAVDAILAELKGDKE